MSCILALAIPQIGFVCGDTRLNLHFPSGEHIINDNEPFEFTGFTDGSSITIGVSERKVKKFNWGWCCASGSLPLIYWCFKNLESMKGWNVDYVRKNLKETYDEKESVIKKSFTNGKKEIEPTAIFCLIRERNIFSIFPYQFGLSGKSQPTSNYYLITPPDILPDHKKHVISEFEKGIS